MKKTKTPTHRRKRNDASPPIYRILKAVLIGTAASLVCSLILSVIFSLICIKQKDPASMTNIFSILSLGLSVFAGGTVSSKLYPDYAPLLSVITSALFMLILFLTSFVLHTESTFSLPISLIIRITTLFLGFLGGLVGKSHRRQRHRYPYI